MVHWFKCSATVMRKKNDDWEVVKRFQLRTGKVRLPAGLMLTFFGDGGLAKEILLEE